MIERNLVVDAYRVLLDRNPDSEEAIQRKEALPNIDALIDEVITSEEFLSIHAYALREIFG